MKGPGSLVRSDSIQGYENQGPLYEWSEAQAYLLIDRITFEDKAGAILCYYNPPVHQVGNPGLDAYLEGLDQVYEKRDDLEFLILYGANDPVHAGGDLKESLNQLDRTLEMKKEKEKTGASADEVDRLFDWADSRLRKGRALHRKIRSIAENLRVVAVCGGGTRFGGSAEIPLMADYLVGDSRSGMCFSEATIGLIPGWAGIARSLIKAGPTNVKYMGKTAREVKAEPLEAIGIYNVVVPIPFPFPKRQKSDDPQADKAAFLNALEDHDKKTGSLLLPEGMRLGICPLKEIAVIGENQRQVLATEAEIAEEVDRRKDPDTYAHLWGKPLKEVKQEIANLGKPLAPQSIQALEGLLEGVEPETLDEHVFVEKEMEADARLYRDPRFRTGLTATLQQTIADYREAQ
ncbi:MAG: enoyl-CoA hydratase/isomerase family protein [Thermodesulfobacteriota bacterium]